MDQATPAGEGAGAGAASSDPGHGVGVPQEAKLLWQALRGLAHGHLELAALETQQAGESLVAMVVAGMFLAGLLLSAWLGVLGMAILALTRLRGHGVGWRTADNPGRQLGRRPRALARDRAPESPFTVSRQCPRSGAGVIRIPGRGDILMATDLPSPRTGTPSLTLQISAAARRLEHRRRLVGVHGLALRRTFHQWMTEPTTLLLAGSMGFLMGELTHRHALIPRGAAPSPNSGHSFFDTARTVIALVKLVRPLFSGLPGVRTKRPAAADGWAPAAAPPDRSRATASGAADEGPGDPIVDPENRTAV
jgi:hypothetical protein